MSESFDPYKKWLGISPKDQPPNFYRLLGLELFEADLDVITTAADSRMALVKKFQSGQYSALSQQLLNEIAAARLGLLNAEKKSQYDLALRETLKPAVKQAAPPPARKSATHSGDAGGGNVDWAALRTAPVLSKDAQAAAIVSSIARRGQKPAWRTPAAVGAGVLLLGLVVLIVVLNRGDGTSVGQQTDTSSEQPVAPPQKTDKTKPPAPKQPKDNGSKTPVAKTPEIKTPEPKIDEHPPEPLPKETPKTSPELDPNRTLAALLDPPDGDPPAKEVIPAKKPPEPKPENPPEAKKPAVPDDAALQRARKRVWDVYGKDVSASKTAQDKLAICEKMLKQGHEEKNDLAVRYALYAAARDVAADAESIEQALAAVDIIEASFDADGTSMKADLLDGMLKAVKAGPAAAATGRLVADAALDLCDSAVAADDFDTAGRFLRLATTAARKANDKLLQREITANREPDLKRQKTRYTTIKAAIDTLADNPADADANRAVGHWYCFVKGNWEKGLPLLAKGIDVDLAKLAAQDLAAPNDPKDQRTLGEQWSKVAAKEPAYGRLQPYLRAAYWYQQALPKLAGLDKSEVEKQIDVVTAAVDAPGAKNLGVVQRGNVALASNGTTVSGAEKGQLLLDGDSTSYTGSTGFAYGKVPCTWTITFPKVYRLQLIRILLWDKDAELKMPRRFFRYSVEVSADGQRFVSLADRSQGQWFGLQEISFAARPVKAIRLIGLYGSASPDFTVVELEAYCVPPKKS
jgi:hypothetical protein